jgi:predicted GNAT family N-acyltransferase
MDELLLVRAAECRPLREAILRPGQPPEAYTYAADDHAQALHFAVKTPKGAVQGVASLLPEARTDGGRETWRLRGMAVVPERRGAGLGRMLLQAVQAVVQQRGGGLWCTARTNVEAFYLAHGFRREGDVFDLPGGGPHVLMTWAGVGKRMKPVPRRGAPGARPAARPADGPTDEPADEAPDDLADGPADEAPDELADVPAEDGEEPVPGLEGDLDTDDDGLLDAEPSDLPDPDDDRPGGPGSRSRP